MFQNNFYDRLDLKLFRFSGLGPEKGILVCCKHFLCCQHLKLKTLWLWAFCRLKQLTRSDFVVSVSQGDQLLIGLDHWVYLFHKMLTLQAHRRRRTMQTIEADYSFKILNQVRQEGHVTTDVTREYGECQILRVASLKQWMNSNKRQVSIKYLTMTVHKDNDYRHCSNRDKVDFLFWKGKNWDLTFATAIIRLTTFHSPYTSNKRLRVMCSVKQTESRYYLTNS